MTFTYNRKGVVIRFNWLEARQFLSSITVLEEIRQLIKDAYEKTK